MTGKEFKRIYNDIGDSLEEFSFCFGDSSNYTDIKDKTFQKLRKAYLSARLELMDFLGLENQYEK